MLGQAFTTHDVTSLTMHDVTDGSYVKIRDKIKSVEFTEYDVCNTCKTSVVQMGSNNFCPKCNKTDVSTAQKCVSFTLSLSNRLVEFSQQCCTLL